MKVTLDSTEPLEHALRVIGALYNVTLTQAEQATDPATNRATTTTRTTHTRRPGAAAASGSPLKPSPQAAAPRGAVRRSRRGAETAAAPKTSDIRAWAQANGHQISDRGRLPAAVIADYHQLRPQG